MVRNKQWIMGVAMGLGMVLSVGCATSPTRQLVKNSPFTKPETLEKIKQQEVRSEKLIEDDGVRVESWALSGALPDTIGLSPLQASDDLEGALLDAISSGRNKELRATRGMSCAAREMGWFALHHDGKEPAESIKDFIRHRCGVVASQLSVMSWSLNLSEGQKFSLSMLNDEFYTDLKSSVPKWLKKVGPSEVGIATVEIEGKAGIYVVAGKRNINMNPIKMVPKGDVVRIEGELLTNAVELGGAVTSGDYGAEHCVVDSRVKLPQFRMTCPLSSADKRARFELYSQTKGSILTSVIFDQMVWPAGVIEDEYRASTIRQVLKGFESPVQGDERYLVYLNKVRESAGLSPLSLLLEQSSSAHTLVPNLFDALRQDDDDTSNDIVMGLLAGWDVQEDILDAHLRIAGVADGSIVSLIEDMLESPGGRASLLDPDGNALALGEVREENGSLGAIMLVYEFVPQETYIRRIARAWRTINAARKLSKKSPIKRSKKVLSRSEKISKKIESGEWSYDKGVERLLDVVSAAYGNVSVYSYTYITHDLEDFSLHADLLDAKSAEAVVMVTPLKVEGYPWTLYTVVIVVPSNRLKK